MKTTLRKAVISEGVLQDLSRTKMSTLTAWKILKILNTLSKETQIFRDIREEKIKEYGTINQETGEYFVPENTDNYNTIVRELEEVLNSEIELDIKPIDIHDIEDLEIDMPSLSAIEWLIKD